VRRRGLPAVGFVHDDWMLYGVDVDGWIRAFRRRALAAGAVERLAGVPTSVDLDAAARWAFVSESTRRRALASVDLRRTAVAHSGVETALFTPRPERPWAWRLAIVGRIDERKGAATAIRALALLPEAGLAVHGRGDDRELERLRELARECGVAERVSFGGAARDRLPGLYAEADAIVFPVLWEEPWGLVPLEAMAVGRPVVATGSGGSGEYLRDGENCLLFSPADDPEALAGAVRRIGEDPALRTRLRERGLSTAAAHSDAAFHAAVASLLDDR
jgi:glycosyltransferase involved in cell wall biosynthesis